MWVYVSTVKRRLSELISDKKFWEELIAYFPWYDTGHIENDASNNFLLLRVYLLPRWRSYRAVG
jgi:hypothetical protein